MYTHSYNSFSLHMNITIFFILQIDRINFSTIAYLVESIPHMRKVNALNTNVCRLDEITVDIDSV